MAAMMFFTQAARAQINEQDTLTEAQRDYIKGDLDAAKLQFQLVLEVDPHNMIAQNYLRMIATKQNNSGNDALQKTLDALVLPHVQLKDATFDTALDYLKQTAVKISDGKTKVNFVVAVPAEIAAQKRVTLDLADVPFTAVLHYITEQTGFQFVIDQYAITVKLPSAATPASVASGTDAVPAPDASMPVQK